jgi:phage shock protein PspC (stress-responsive transcriptional regulator)
MTSPPPAAPTADAGPTAPPPAPPRRLVRLVDDKKVAGVAAGVAWYLGIDPTVVRIGLVVLTLATGLGVPAYVAAWVLLPEARRGDPDAGPPGDGDHRTAGLAVLAALVGLALLGRGDLLHGQVVAGAALVGVGALLLSDRGPRTWGRGAWPTSSAWGAAATAVAPPPPPAPAAPGGPAQDRASAYGPYGAGPGGRPDDRPPRRRSALGLVGLAVWLVAAGTASLLDRAGVVDVGPATGLGLALAVLGGTLVVGTVVGRARWLIPLGVVLVLALLATSAASRSGVDLSGDVGEHVARPTTVEQVADPFRLLAGRQELDLTALDTGGRAVLVRAEVTVGELVVRVPDDVEVEVRGTVRGGQATVFGEVREGEDLSLAARRPGPEGGGRIVLDLAVVFGQVDVESVSR